MINGFVNVGRKALMIGGKFVVDQTTQGALDIGKKIGNDIIEKQKSLIKIPDLKDVLVEEALRVLKDELNLIPTSAIARPNLTYADQSENEVVYSEPKFGKKVDPKTTVKIYYLTQEVIDKSKELLVNQVQEFIIPKVVGLDIYDAREDLEGLGVKVTEKIEKPDPRFINNENGQVTKITYPNNQKIGSKIKTGDRVWLYYVTEDVISESLSMKAEKVKEGQERIEKVEKAAKGIAKDIYAGVVDLPQNVAKKIGNPFEKKKVDPDPSEE